MKKTNRKKNQQLKVIRKRKTSECADEEAKPVKPFIFTVARRVSDRKFLYWFVCCESDMNNRRDVCNET